MEGIIPALAGNTFRSLTDAENTPDHPRSRGEYFLLLTQPRKQPGSSPLSRGIRCSLVKRIRELRIIPALAGNTQIPPGSSCKQPDHPRSRGEYLDQLQDGDVVVGSSPLSRGILFTLGSKAEYRGIIPALAGNTHLFASGWFRVRDHPRSRGEYLAAGDPGQAISGSSPLSRGILRPNAVRSPPRWIIPALAGNTRVMRVEQLGGWDHPRSRGEYSGRRCATPSPHGSSPLSRGIRGPQDDVWPDGGIIPALAGNTIYGRPKVGKTTDHPRSRGEYIRME